MWKNYLYCEPTMWITWIPWTGGKLNSANILHPLSRCQNAALGCGFHGDFQSFYAAASEDFMLKLPWHLAHSSQLPEQRSENLSRNKLWRLPAKLIAKVCKHQVTQKPFKLKKRTETNEKEDYSSEARLVLWRTIVWSMRWIGGTFRSS